MATITVKPNGPYLVVGADIVDAQGRTFSYDASKPVALCRCGASANKPFCDGSHQRIGFKAEETAETARGG